MSAVDVASFTRYQDFLAIRCPVKQVHTTLKHPAVSPHIRRGGTRCVLSPADVKEEPQSDEHKDEKYIILLPKFKSADDLPACLQAILDAPNSCLHLETVKIKTTYDELSAHEVLTQLLPKDVLIPTAFETIGHIAHVNLAASQLPYKSIIGQVFLDKNPVIKTVVNKSQSIDSEFRACPVEVIAGEDNLITTLVENGCRFYVDYASVFWNSRLSKERENVTELVPKGSIVCDVMGGVGPFGVFLAKLKGCEVYCNDLNPAARGCVEKNVELNKLQGKIMALTMDGRDFIRQSLEEDGEMSVVKKGEVTPLQRDWESGKNKVQSKVSKSHNKKRQRLEDQKSPPDWKLLPDRPIFFIMNLPAIAVTFLDVFKVYKAKDGHREINVLVYCFAKDQNGAREKVLTACPSTLLNIREVRDVAPQKLMYCCHLKMQ